MAWILWACAAMMVGWWLTFSAMNLWGGRSPGGGQHGGVSRVSRVGVGE